MPSIILVIMLFCLLASPARADYVLPPNRANQARGVDGCVQTPTGTDCSRRYGSSGGGGDIFLPQTSRAPSSRQVARYLEARRLLSRACPFSLGELPAERAFYDYQSLHLALDALLDAAQAKLAYLNQLSREELGRAHDLERLSANRAGTINSLQDAINRLQGAVSYLKAQTRQAERESSRLQNRLSRLLAKLDRIESENQTASKNIYGFLAKAAGRGLLLSPANYLPRPPAPRPAYNSQLIWAGQRQATLSVSAPRAVRATALPPSASAVAAESRSRRKPRPGGIDDKLKLAEDLAKTTGQVSAQYRANSARAQRARQRASRTWRSIEDLSARQNRLERRKASQQRTYDAAMERLRKLQNRIHKARLALPLEAIKWACLKIYEEYIFQLMAKMPIDKVNAPARAKLIKIGQAMVLFENGTMETAAQSVSVLGSVEGDLTPFENRLEQAKTKFAIDFYSVLTGLPSWVVELLPHKKEGR